MSLYFSLIISPRLNSTRSVSPCWVYFPVHLMLKVINNDSDLHITCNFLLLFFFLKLGRLLLDLICTKEYFSFEMWCVEWNLPAVKDGKKTPNKVNFIEQDLFNVSLGILSTWPPLFSTVTHTLSLGPTSGIWVHINVKINRFHILQDVKSCNIRFTCTQGQSRVHSEL